MRGLMNLRIGRRGVITDLGDVHGIEDIVVTAVVAVHINFAFVGEDAINLFIRQRLQRAGAAFAGAGALELHALRVVDRDFFFMIQAPQHIICRQGEQLFRLNGLGKRRQVLEVGSLGILCRHHLQQHPARHRLAFMIAGADDKARRQLL